MVRRTSHEGVNKEEQGKQYLKRMIKDWKTWLIIILGLVFYFFTVYTIPAVDSDLIIILLFLYVFGLLSIAWGLQRYYEKNLIETTPTSKIRSLALGECEVEGKVRPTSENDVMIAPLTQQRCVYYRYSVVEERRTRRRSRKKGRRKKRWVELDGGKQWVPFLVEDDTGAVMVDPNDATEEFELDVTHTVYKGEEPPPKIKDFVNRNPNLRPLSQSHRRARRRRYSETFIAPGDDLYIFGKAMERRANDHLGNVVISSDDTTPLFRISDSSEEELIEKYSKRTWWSLAIGVVLILISYGAMLYSSGML